MLKLNGEPKPSQTRIRNLNTSHVKVKRVMCMILLAHLKNLNTSHVKVKLHFQYTFLVGYMYLNTSHVKVKQLCP